MRLAVKRLAALMPLAALALALSLPVTTAAQAEGALRIEGVSPYDRAVPGQIVELRVQGFGERFTSPPENSELRVLLTQDGTTQAVPVRTASPGFVSEAQPARAAAAPAPDFGLAGMRAYQGLTFVVPRGLHAGEAEVVVTYRRQRSAPFKFQIVERPLRPLVGGTSIVTISPASLPPPRKGDAASSLGLRFERGARHVEMHVRPLPDPEDADAAVLVRFRQGGAYYDAAARVLHQDKRTESIGGRGLRLLPARDLLEIDVPEMLAPGEAEVEVCLRVGGQTGEAAVLPVTITDAERAFESPNEAAPRMLAVTPQRVGAGQPLMISVDRRRTLDPDPSKARVVFEAQDGTLHTVSPEMNGAVLRPDTGPDAPVLLIVRAPEGVVGTARVRLLNPARDVYAGAASEPAQVEIVAETLPPEVSGVAEATSAELAQLRQMYEAQARAGRAFPEYDPAARYVTIRATGLDYNPRFLRVRMEQDGRPAVTLGPGDFSLFSNNSLVVRVPKEIGPGAVRLSVENRGAAGYSAPVVRTFELPARQ